MTPETLARINDLRSRVVEADAARRAGDHQRASALDPSTDEIIAALKAIRTDRASAIQSKVTKTEAKAETKRLSTIDLKELFGD